MGQWANSLSDTDEDTLVSRWGIAHVLLRRRSGGLPVVDARNRTWLIPTAVGVVAVLALTTFALKYREERRLRPQHEAAAEIARLGGNVQFIGDRYFAANLQRVEAGDAAMEQVAAFHQLEQLDAERSPVTDNGLRHVASLRAMHFLTLTDTRVTGAGLAHLRDMTELESLRSANGGDGRWSRTPAGDEPAPVPDFVRDAGDRRRAAHLEDLPVLLWLSVSATEVTDAGLGRLTNLQSLRYLHVRGSRVTGAGIDGLRCARPDIAVNPTGDWDEDGCCNEITSGSWFR